jgi:hypothetical protein
MVDGVPFFICRVEMSTTSLSLIYIGGALVALVRCPSRRAPRRTSNIWAFQMAWFALLSFSEIVPLRRGVVMVACDELAMGVVDR